MKKRFKKFSNGSSNNLGEKSFDEVDRIFNLSGDYTKGNITQSQNDFNTEDNQKSPKDMFFEEGVTQILGIYDGMPVEEIKSIIYGHYIRKDEYLDDKKMLHSILETALNYNRMLQRFNTKLEQCKKNNIRTDWFSEQIEMAAEERNTFKSNAEMYFKTISDFIYDVMPVLKNAITTSAKKLCEGINCFENIISDEKIIIPELNELYKIFEFGHEDNPKLNFANRDITNFIANYIEYKNINNLNKEYISLTELFYEYMEDYKLGGSINDSPLRIKNPNIIKISKSQIEDLLLYCFSLNKEYCKKDKIAERNVNKFESSINSITKQLSLQGRENEAQSIISKQLVVQVGHRNLINIQCLKVNKAAKIAYDFARRLKKSNLDRSTLTVQFLENFEGLLNTMSLNSLKHPDKIESIYVHLIEIQEIINCLGESAKKSVPFIKNLAKTTFGDKITMQFE